MQIAQCIFTGAQDQPSLEFISMCILNLPPIRWSPKSFNHLKAKLQFMVWAPGASGSTWAPWSFLLCDVTICANSHNNCGLCRKFMFFGNKWKLPLNVFTLLLLPFLDGRSLGWSRGARSFFLLNLFTRSLLTEGIESTS